jgi:hypothetical protein
MRIVAGLAVAAVVLVATHAAADVRRERPDRRPYIVEIDHPYEISVARVAEEAKKLSDMAKYIEYYGYPEYAEIQEIQPVWPWDQHEVRLFYVRRNLQLDFGRVVFSPAAPNYGVLKHRSEIPPEKLRRIELILEARRTPAPSAPATAEAPAPAPVAATEPQGGGLTEALVARIEAAAERASQAADRAVEHSDAANRAADRAVNLVDSMEAEL